LRSAQRQQKLCKFPVGAEVSDVTEQAARLATRCLLFLTKDQTEVYLLSKMAGIKGKINQPKHEIVTFLSQLALRLYSEWAGLYL